MMQLKKDHITHTQACNWDLVNTLLELLITFFNLG